ncbi:MGDG synthase family glycosyltransferase [Alloiococcus sp. CFN-8]|uniref:MGDG synthase family glycosyltransferase n=1 Tax=Alloiococcus sp. CFN-8 TaxID=3416081 RepID=UPI003CEEEBD6
MNKVLILTASTGEGHNQAADSLKHSFQKQGFQVEKYDILKDNNKLLNKFVVGGYELLVAKSPKVYGGIYNITNFSKINLGLRPAFIHSQYKIYSFIKSFKPSAIIGTHPFSVNIIASLKKNKDINLPFISIVTDFKAHYAYLSPYVDAYITACEDTKDTIDNEIVPHTRVYPLGIPIKEEFFTKTNLKRELLESTPAEDFFNILLMGGSMGVNNITHVLTELLKNTHRLRITVVCGNNRVLKKSLENRYEEYKKSITTAQITKKVHVFGFTNIIPSLMELSDVIISKPGGLTISEALIKKLPMIFPFTIPGQEAENAEFLAERGCAIYEPNITKLNEIIDTIINNPAILNTMKDNIEDLSKFHSTNGIVNLTEALISSYKK